MPYLAEAMRALEEGVGTAEDIDTGARVGLNHPMGPLELADFIGLDICLAIMDVLVEGSASRTWRRRRCCATWSRPGTSARRRAEASTRTRGRRVIHEVGAARRDADPRVTGRGVDLGDARRQRPNGDVYIVSPRARRSASSAAASPTCRRPRSAASPSGPPWSGPA